jgi:hypothetical protein
MTRDQLITPKRIDYAKEQEKNLYAELMQFTQKKQNEVQAFFRETIDQLRQDIPNAAAQYTYGWFV